jgi:hypothetical protein
LAPSLLAAVDDAASIAFTANQSSATPLNQVVVESEHYYSLYDAGDETTAKLAEQLITWPSLPASIGEAEDRSA